MTDTTTGTSTTDVARETATVAGKEVAGTAVEEARGVAAVAADQAATVSGQAMDQARSALDGATGEVRDQLEQRLRDLAAAARTTSEELQALVDGRPDDAGRTRDVARQASEQIGRFADRADELGVQGVVEEVTDLARRRPVLFLAGAATAGVLVGRIARAGKEARSDGSPAPSSAGDVPVGAPTTTAPLAPPPGPVGEPAAVVPPVSGTRSGWEGA